MSEPVPEPVVKTGCALCNLAKTYAIPLIIVGVAIAVYLYRKNNQESK